MLPLTLTAIRFVLAPCFILLYLKGGALGLVDELLFPLLFPLLLAMEATDALDGYLARKYNQVTDLGKILDPMVDSVSHLAIFLAFTTPPVDLPLGLVLLLVYRESLIGAVRTLLALRGVALAARMSGKLKSTAQALALIAIILLLIAMSWGWMNQEMVKSVSTNITVVVVCITLASCVDYLYSSRRPLLLSWTSHDGTV